MICRMYTLRRTRDAFKDNKKLSDESAIKTCIKEAEENLDTIKRQVILVLMLIALAGSHYFA